MIFKAVNITKISKIAIYFQTENTKCKKFQSKKKITSIIELASYEFFSICFYCSQCGNEKKNK